MKNRLIHQSSEFDCGPTTLINALRFLYEREEIPPMLLKGIWIYGNDAFNDCGEMGKQGTSKAAIRFFANWFNDMGQNCRFPIRAEYVHRAAADITPDSRTVQCLREGGVALMRCWSEGIGHYVLLTSLEEDGSIGLFDPYDEPDEEVPKAEGLRIIHGQDYRMNRTAPMELLNRRDRSNYAMGDDEKRVNLLIWRKHCCRADKE